MLKTWREGAFKGDYKKFHKTILRTMPPDQSPTLASGQSEFGVFAGKTVYDLGKNG